jgi:DNA-binding LytR/AlgR family response regulator
MTVLIIEDEIPARAKLVQMLNLLDPSCHIAGQVGSVQESLSWLKTNPSPDIAFVDIQLSDDHSFEIFREFPVNFPVVFTTAYDRYLLESFEHSSIDYLLKPITEEKLSRSLQKLKNLKQHFLEGNLEELLQRRLSKSSQRIVAKKGTEFLTLQSGDIAYFFTEHKIVFVKDKQGRNLITDYTLNELEELFELSAFFRINRKFLCALSSIEKFKSDNGKILVQLNPPMVEDIFVSKETAPAFRQWVGKR